MSKQRSRTYKFNKNVWNLLKTLVYTLAGFIKIIQK